MARVLPDGLYEDILTGELAASLDGLAPRLADLRRVDSADLPAVLARHVAREVERALGSIADDAERLTMVERLLERLARVPEDLSATSVVPPPRFLDAIYRNAAPSRPSTPLSSSTLLTNTRRDPGLGHELQREMASADAIHLLSAFITMGGVRVAREVLEAFSRRGKKLRVLTTVFTGTTEVSAVDALASLAGAEVRVSYDVRRTRLHAKAWLFERDTGLHTAYVGSANLTATALGSGQEWMVKICAADLPHVIGKFRGTFESLWNDGEFEPYDPKSEEHRARLRRALREQTTGAEGVVHLFTLRPFPFQEEILDRLAAERELHGRRRNLVVAATGTGKTVVAAFDYARIAAAARNNPRLLFLAHRKELLEQARATFRQVLRDGAFGELLADGEEPGRWEHVFATIQTASRRLEERTAPDHFRYVVIDECHHAPASSYQQVMAHLRPEILLGLTATPERSDGKSLLVDFDGRISAELRLWHALERQLLVPFEYFGVADQTDLTRLRWRRAGYDTDELARVYTGNESRVDLIVGQLARRVADLRAIRALAFCVSVEHAEFMARALSARGVPSMAVHGGTSADDRASARRKLQEREVNVLCTCDLYNEGIDLPYVDTLLLLRPTSSPTLFIQQLGRGLRVHDDKTSCLVLDFIGQHRAEFRFDEIYSAMSGIPRAKLVDAVRAGFPFLPSGCVLELDAVARERVLAGLQSAVAKSAQLVREIRDQARGDLAPTLRNFLEHSGRDLEDVYRLGGWSNLLSEAGLVPPLDPEEAELSRHLGWLLHVDEPERLRDWRSALEVPVGDVDYARRMTMLDFQLHHRGVVREPDETVRYLASKPAVSRELSQLAEVLEDRVQLIGHERPVPEWPLALHRHYRRREIVAAIGFVTPGMKGKIPQGGLLKLDDQQRELMFVTLDKSAKSFSPTTRYRDYAMSPTLFHWETQSTASVSRPSGRRYLESPGNGWSFYLFVRTDPEAPYAFLGPARLRSFAGDRPIAITWELEHAMPPMLFEKFATLAQG